MKNKSVIFFDIDGTLLDHEKQLPLSTKKAVKQLKEAGHIVAIATGRAPFMYEDLRKELSIDTYVSYNGSYVVVEGKEIFTNPLDIPSLEKMTADGLARNHPIVYMDATDMKANVPEHAYINESIATLKIKHFPTHDPAYYQGRDIYQSLFFCTEGEEVYYQEKYPSFDFVRWHPLSVDVLPKGGSKANGIKYVLEALRISEANQYAFGDGLNDIEMLRSIPNSVAMGNAVEEVKEVAKYVTKDVSDDGILHGLTLVGLVAK